MVSHISTFPNPSTSLKGHKPRIALGAAEIIGDIMMFFCTQKREKGEEEKEEQVVESLKLRDNEERTVAR